jgi:hypothetical protein
MEQKERYLNALKQARERGYNVILVPSATLKDFAAMNDEAGRKMGFLYKGKRLPNKTILIDRDMPIIAKIHNLKHEIIEMELMEKHRLPYWKAHLIALKKEKLP